MDIISWKRSLQAYGRYTCTTSDDLLLFRDVNVWFFKFAAANSPDRVSTCTLKASEASINLSCTPPHQVATRKRLVHRQQHNTSMNKGWPLSKHHNPRYTTVTQDIYKH